MQKEKNISNTETRVSISIDNANWDDFVNWRLGTTSDDYELVEDIRLTSPVGMISGTFSGKLDGNGHTIKVDIIENVANVGLFSQLENASVLNLTIDGYVIGGASSQYVGGLAGRIENSEIFNCLNIADVTGESQDSSVGGITGELFSDRFITFSDCSNNGTIIGGDTIGGVIGKSNINGIIRTCKNAGTIQKYGDTNPNYMAGIVGKSIGTSVSVYFCVNIGTIESESSRYAGGIAASIENGSLHTSSNAGIVYGARDFVGGIIGFIDGSSNVYACINTNWVEPIGTSGAIVGHNEGRVNNCYYDEQMCVLPLGVGLNTGTATLIDGRPTTSMIDVNLPPPFDGPDWIPHPQLYPVPPFGATGSNEHPISLLSAAPIYLPTGINIGSIPRFPFAFDVSNADSSPIPGAGVINPIDYPYLWSSINGVINIPSSTSSLANVVAGRSGADTLRVILTSNPTYPNYGIYEKVVPIYIP